MGSSRIVAPAFLARDVRAVHDRDDVSPEARVGPRRAVEHDRLGEVLHLLRVALHPVLVR